MTKKEYDEERINNSLGIIEKLEAENKELSKSVERITKLYDQERDNNQMFKLIEK